MTKWFKKAAGVAALAVAATGLVSAPAQADTGGCTGSQVDLVPHYNGGGTLIAQTGVYWNGTQMCIVTVKKNHLYGKLTRIDQHAARQNRSTYAWTHKDKANQMVNYWAGPLNVNGQNACVKFHVVLWNNGNVIADDENYRLYCH